MDNQSAIKAYQKRRKERMDEFQNGENWVTIRGVHVLLDKHGNVINNFKDPKHKLKNLRFVDAVSSHTEGGKKVIDAPLRRKTQEAKFNESMGKITDSLGASAISKDDAQKRVANALANLEQGAIVQTDSLSALKLGKGLYKIKGEKGNLTAKQLAERIMKDVKVSDASNNVSGMPKVKTGTNTNVIQKGSKRITHVATNALEELYNKYKSNKYSYSGLKDLATDYLFSLPKNTELTVGGNKFTKDSDDYWTIEHDGTAHKISLNSMSSMLLSSMSTGYAGGTIQAKVPEAAEAVEAKVEEAAEKIAEDEPKKEPESFPSEEDVEKMAAEYEKESAPKLTKPISESMTDIGKGEGTSAEKADKMLEFLKGLPDGTPITYEATNKYTGELYTVKGTKQGDKIKFFSKEAPLHSMASSFVKKIEKGLMVGGSDEGIFATSKGTETEGSTGEAAKAEPAKESAASAPPTKTYPTEKLQKTSTMSYDASKYTPEKKAAAQAEWDSKGHGKHYEAKYKAKTLEWFGKLPATLKKWFEGYTGSGYSSLNNALRNAGTLGLTDYEKSKAQKMTEAIAESKFDEPTYLRRGVSFFTFANMVGMTEKELVEAAKGDAAALREMFVDGVAVENGFASCGSAKHTGFTFKPVDMEIYCPEGTEAVFANPWSVHKSSATTSGEFETILQRGSAFKITDISYDKSTKRMRVKCEVVAQRVLFDNFGEDISDKLAA